MQAVGRRRTESATVADNRGTGAQSSTERSKVCVALPNAAPTPMFCLRGRHAIALGRGRGLALGHFIATRTCARSALAICTQLLAPRSLSPLPYHPYLSAGCVDEAVLRRFSIQHEVGVRNALASSRETYACSAIRPRQRSMLARSSPPFHTSKPRCLDLFPCLLAMPATRASFAQSNLCMQGPCQPHGACSNQHSHG